MKISIEVIVNRDIETVWTKWISPDSIVMWNHASPDWYCPKAANNLTVGGTFSYIMSARDKSVSFDFNGIYTTIIPLNFIGYTLEGGRTVEVTFKKIGNSTTKIVEIFEAEMENTEEKQREGWSAILKNFKLHCEKTM